MNTQKEDRILTKSERVKGILLFLLHWVLMIAVIAVLLFGDKLGAIGETFQGNAANYLYMLFCLFLLTGILYFYLSFENKNVVASGKSITLLFTILDIYLILAVLIGTKLHIYARPMAMVALLIYALIGRQEAIIMNIICSLIVFVVDNFSTAEQVANNIYTSLFLSFSSGMIAIFLFEYAKTRVQVVGIGIVIVVPVLIMIFLLELSTLLEGDGGILNPSNYAKLLESLGFGLFGGVGSTIFYLALLPVFEAMFNRLTSFRVRELMGHDAKLLKTLQQEANGTYNHSQTVALLAGACADAIGEDADFAKAAALYHDVGKLHQPEYFTENQDGYNIHDELTPELSADIVRSHAQDGYDLILSSGLPKFLADVALQHHGTLPIRYFYAKALKMTDGDLNIEEFSYLGPKPQTKIAAIIMIVDAAEAAVRSLKSRSSENVEKVVREIIEERMELEQFAECDVTMADLTKIRLKLVEMLSGVYHHRVNYPKLKYKHNQGKTFGENE